MGVCVCVGVCVTVCCVQSDAERQLCVSTVEAFLTEQGQALIDGKYTHTTPTPHTLPPTHAGLVSGFVSLRSFMTVESCEVLWEMLTCAKEVSGTKINILVLPQSSSIAHVWVAKQRASKAT